MNSQIDDIKVREKKFHDNRFVNDKRKSLNVIYDFNKPVKEFFNNIVNKNVIGKKILELGCGIGINTIAISKKGAAATGIDISSEAISRAKNTAQEHNENVQYYEMSIEDMSFNEHSFDKIFGSGILHHTDLSNSLYQIKRVLKEDGQAIFFEPLGHNPLINLFRKLTPSLRSVDEHPLLMQDFDLIKKIFPNTIYSYFHLSTFLIFPFIKSGLFMNLFNKFNKLDKLIFEKISFIKKYAWIVIIQINNQSANN